MSNLPPTRTLGPSQITQDHLLTVRPLTQSQLPGPPGSSSTQGTGRPATRTPLRPSQLLATVFRGFRLGTCLKPHERSRVWGSLSIGFADDRHFCHTFFLPMRIPDLLEGHQLPSGRVGGDECPRSWTLGSVSFDLVSKHTFCWV